MTIGKREKPFQKVANEYAHRVIASIIDDLAAYEHSKECDGTKDNGKPCKRGSETRTYRQKFDAHVPSNGEVYHTPGIEKPCANCGAELAHDPPEKCVKVTRQMKHNNSEAWHDQEAAQRTIDETPLSLEVRSDWHSVGESGEPSEYCILLSTGGPAARIVGALNGHCEPTDARFEYQDWFKPWTAANDLSREEEDALLQFAGNFYFGQ